MSQTFFPKGTPVARPNKEDRDYAQYFKDLARVLDASPQSERLTLRLSTCRNAYLTINALFVDLKEILGHGRTPSLLAQSISYLRRGLLRPLEGVLSDIRLRTESFVDKLEVWKKRVELDRCLAVAVSALDDPLAELRVRQLLYSVRSHPEGGPASAVWDSRWHELSVREDVWAAEKLALLHQVFGVVDAIVTVARAASDVLREKEELLREKEKLLRENEEGSLFESDEGHTRDEGHESDEGRRVSDRWSAFYQCVRGHSQALGMDRREGNSLAWYVPGKEGGRLPEQVGSMEEAVSEVGHLCDVLEQCERNIYESLVTQFRPNVSHPPLPPPYCIDLSDGFSTKSAGMKLSDALERMYPRTFGRAAPQAITVALCEFGIPAAYYDPRLVRYVRDEHRREAENAAMAALESLAGVPSPVLVLPELFLPSTSVERVTRFARDKSITLIAGVEPIQGPGGLPLNQAIIMLPHLQSEFRQQKSRNSPYENRFNYDTTAVHVLGGTDIGSFAVLVCSDLREFDLIAAIANADFLIDTLFVCSYNPQPELFEAFATADAARLYCHVVIANCCSEEGEGSNNATPLGTLVCSPMTKHEDRRRSPNRSVPLPLTPIGGISPSLALYELKITDLRNEKEKPAKKYMNCPHFRRSLPHV